MRPRKKVSQTQIAKELGVSQALVSLALNGLRDAINPDTYQRIWEHALSLGYQPKGMKFEQSPREAQLHQVGFILRAGLNIHTQGSYFGHVLHGLHTALDAAQHAALFLGSEDTLTRRKLASFFRPGHALRGVVLFGEVGPPFLRLLRTFEQPLVAVSARHPGLTHSVLGNEPQALESIVQHLHTLGHRRIGWIGGNVGLGRQEARHRAYLAALQQFELGADARYAVFRPGGDLIDGLESMHGLLESAKRKDFPTAFIAYNTHLAIGAVRALQQAGWPVPAQLSIASADYSEIGFSAVPSITLAGSDPEKLGAAAARLLLAPREEADSAALTELVLPSTFKAGASTGPARGA